jgi:hypothetical protein
MERPDHPSEYVANLQKSGRSQADPPGLLETRLRSWKKAKPKEGVSLLGKADF